MASELHVVVVGDGDAECAVELLSDLEAHWSRFLHDSDITRLNHAAGLPLRVDPSTVTLVATMVEAWRSTDGAFDPSVLPALIESGYRTSIDDPYRVTFLPDGRLVVGGYDAGPTMDDIVIDREGSTITLPPGLVIDPGGIGKGLAADLAVRHLLSLGAAGALVSIGGDMAMAGTPPLDADGWTVALAHPDPSSAPCARSSSAAVVWRRRVLAPVVGSTRAANGTIRSTRVERSSRRPTWPP